MWKKMLLMLALVALAVGGLGYYKFQQIQAGMAMFASFTPPPTAVTSIKAEASDWQDTLEVIGSFAPVQGVTLSAQDSGQITEIAFTSGARLSQGDLLVQQDVSVEAAQLKSLDAKADLAKAKRQRAQMLFQQKAVSQDDLDTADADLQQTIADANATRATIEHKTIRAPFTGRVGIRQIQLGQYLKPGDPIVTLQTLHPIYLNFNLPQQRIAALSPGQVVELAVDAFPGEKFQGKITAINPLIDDSTRNVQVQATVDNPQEEIRPGMFTQVSLLVGTPRSCVTVPATAINRAPYGNSIYIIEKMKDAKGGEYLGVRQQSIKLGATRGDQVAILEGLQAGEEVVTSGLFKLRQGASISINNTVMPTNSAKPNPSDS